jgi:hypothetical protein
MCIQVMGKTMKHQDHSDFENWLRAQTKNIPEPEVSPEFLAAQRRAIYRRLDQPRGNWFAMRWALSFALLLLVVAGGLTLESRHNRRAPAISDEQLFSDLSAMEQSNEPKAIQPIHGLFQE